MCDVKGWLMPRADRLARSEFQIDGMRRHEPFFNVARPPRQKITTRSFIVGDQWLVDARLHNHASANSRVDEVERCRSLLARSVVHS